MMGYYGTLVMYILLVTAAGVVSGIVSILGFNFLFARSLPQGFRTALGRIQWCMASLGLENTRLVRREHGYELRKVVEKDGKDHVYLGEEEGYLELDDGGYITRFGLVPFGIIWLPEGDRWEEIKADPEFDQTARADGGMVILNSERGGYREFLPSVDHRDDRTLVKIDKAEEPIRNAAGSAQANKAEDDALVQHGGVGNVSNTVIALCGLAALIFGAAMGWFVMSGVV